MTVNEILATSVARSNRWHPGGLTDWSALEWAGATAGEAGEACEAVLMLAALRMAHKAGESANAAKKIQRIESGIKNINVGERSLTDLDKAKRVVCKEAADTILYAIILMARAGETDAESVIRGVFNQKSEEYGFPERL